MARISNIYEFNKLRKKYDDSLDADIFFEGLSNGIESEPTNEIFKIDNSKGTTILTPKDLKEHIDDFIHNEIDLYASVKVREQIKYTELALSDKIKIFEKDLIKHIDNKLDMLSEKIIEMIISRIVEERVNDLVDKKLEKLKNLL